MTSINKTGIIEKVAESVEAASGFQVVEGKDQITHRTGVAGVGSTVENHGGFDTFSTFGGDHNAWVAKSFDYIPSWWSKERDRRLRLFWKRTGAGHLSSAMSNAILKLVGIPMNVVPRDASIVSHVEQAKVTNTILQSVSEFGQGLGVTLEKFYEDFIGQDNGGFIEIIGKDASEASPEDKGKRVAGKAGPLIGQPIAVRHLDSARCTRTSNPSALDRSPLP